jgi:hypothetical protein
MPEAEGFSSIFDVSLLATLGLIFFITLLGAFLRSSHRDPCLKAFQHYHVTLERKSGKVIWGELELVSTGFELLYRDSVQDDQHIESSYVMYSTEFEDIQAIYRYVDDLSPEDKLRRQRDLDRYFHPGLVVRMIRATQHFFSLASDSMVEVMSLIMGRLRRPAGRYLTDVSEDQLTRFSSDVVGSVGTMYDPLLERLVGHKVVVDLLEGDVTHEHVAVFKNYSPDFIELLDVQFPQEHALNLAGDVPLLENSLTVQREENRLLVTNVTHNPVLIQSLSMKEDEELLNVVVDGGETVELYPKLMDENAQLKVRVVRELDLIVSRHRCLVRHRADHYKGTFVPEIVFDIGVMLRGDSVVDAREERLRHQLEETPDSALLAANLGAVLMQKGELAEAQEWLERACATRHSLPDNGRRTVMLLRELERRHGKTAKVWQPQTAKSAVISRSTNGREPVEVGEQG